MSGSTRETRGPNHGEASEAPTDERVGKPIGIAYNWEIWSLLYWQLLLLMKVPIDDYACISLDAPTLPAHEVSIDGITRWRVWCKYCRRWPDQTLFGLFFDRRRRARRPLREHRSQVTAASIPTPSTNRSAKCSCFLSYLNMVLSEKNSAG